MMYIDFNAGNKEYKLRLNTRNIVALEQKLGCNPIDIFGDGSTLPTITTMVMIFHASLQQYQHNINLDKAYEIYDEWISDGNDITEFVKIIVEIYKVSGIVPKEVETTEDAVNEGN